MKKLIVLLLLWVLIYGVACEKKAQEPASSPGVSTGLIIDTVVTSDDSTKPNPSTMFADVVATGDTRSLPSGSASAVDTTMGKGGLPDFTDDGLSWFISNGGAPNSGIVTNCVIPRLNQFFADAANWPGTWFTFTAPDISVPIGPQCITGTYVDWNVTTNQRFAWKCTSPSVNADVINVLTQYSAALVTQPAAPFQLIIQNLDFGSMNYAPYVGVVLTKYMHTDGTSYLWMVNLTRNPPGPICP
ncbi:MAG: hypothetical protein HQ472_04160 [Ignavibacteria bacterium]|nr:hypothetical protein [Ignavibacteria bacterium]